LTRSIGIPFVVAAPSGTGKTTVCHAILERDPKLRFSVSYTTREPRAGEVPGRDYHFVSAAEFRRLNEEGVFLEHAEYGGQLYGTSERALQDAVDAGYDVVIEIEVQGAKQLRDRRPDARFVFLLPPSMEVLETRLRNRGTNREEDIHRRLALADRELAAANLFDWVVVNDDLDEAVSAVLEIVRAERSGRTGALADRFGREAALARWQRQGARSEGRAWQGEP
jgi:guanylate kinase